MSKPSIDPGLITAAATLGLVFGTIGMLISFIPCLGSSALLFSIPSSIVSGLATWFAYKNHSDKGLPVAALTISTLGLIIAGNQAYGQHLLIQQNADYIKHIQQQQMQRQKLN